MIPPELPDPTLLHPCEHLGLRLTNRGTGAIVEAGASGPAGGASGSRHGHGDGSDHATRRPHHRPRLGGPPPAGARRARGRAGPPPAGRGRRRRARRTRSSPAGRAPPASSSGWPWSRGPACWARFGTERLARRLVPLSVLLQMSLGLPDATPSRMAVARRIGGGESLARRVRALQDGTGDDPRWTAASTVVLLVREPRTARPSQPRAQRAGPGLHRHAHRRDGAGGAGPGAPAVGRAGARRRQAGRAQHRAAEGGAAQRRRVGAARRPPAAGWRAGRRPAGLARRVRPGHRRAPRALGRRAATPPASPASEISLGRPGDRRRRHLRGDDRGPALPRRGVGDPGPARAHALRRRAVRPERRAGVPADLARDGCAGRSGRGPG